uniref:Myosin motor domain-containing protein n=1 Tax=Graphocephala atropunctata TaxID=36148 RepID=A0A1B6LA13_9HEMI
MSVLEKKTPITVSPGDYVWISPVGGGTWDIPKAVKVVSTSGKQLKVVDNDNEESWIDPSSVLKALHPTSLASAEDMITLGELEEFTILHNLHIRYRKNVIYTYIGMMLVAINPYRDLPLYGPAEVKRYRGKRMGALPAHIYALGSQSYDNMRRQASSQCIVISGESGSGKTESTKLLMKFLAALSGQNSNIEQQLILANPILEGFGQDQLLLYVRVLAAECRKELHQ